MSCEEDVEQHAERPDIVEHSVVLDSPDDLRRHVLGCAAERIDLRHRVLADAESEINDFDFHFLVYHDVLQLDVSMDHILIVHVFDALQNLRVDYLAPPIVQPLLALPLQIVQKRLLARILHYEIQLQKVGGFRRARARGDIEMR